MQISLQLQIVLAWMMMMVEMSLSLIKELDSLQRIEIIDVFKRSGILCHDMHKFGDHLTKR
jgi:hypothetical protein